MFKQLVKNVVLNIVKDYIEPKSTTAPDGYNPLDKIRDGLFHWVCVPFNGTYIWCQLRCLNATQLDACGAVTLINIVKEHEKEHKASTDANSDTASGGPVMTALLQAATDTTAASYRLDYVNAGSYGLHLVCNASEDQVL